MDNLEELIKLNIEMDDLEDLIKLNNVLKSEAAGNSRAHCDKTISLVNSDVSTDLQTTESRSVATLNDQNSQEICLKVDYTEEIERDVKEAEQNSLLQKVEHLLNSGLEMPICVTESLMILEKEDIEVIDKCTCLQLKKLMLLNRTKRKHLVNVLKQILELLNTANKIIWQNQKEESPKLKLLGFKTGSSSLGIPFFKLRHNKVSCWANVDVERKRQNNELMLCKMVPPIKWTTKDKLLLKKLVAVFYSCARERDLLDKIKKLEVTCKKVKDAEKQRNCNDDIKKMKIEIRQLRNSKSECYPELNSDVDIDWYEISEQMKGRHSANECKAYWNMFLHPDRKEDNWSKSDDNKLTELAKKYHFQNWDKIAEELGDGRSPFAVCSHYYNKLCKRNYRRQKFHPEEDELLLDIIETCKIGNYIPWSKVSYYFGGRTKSQLYHRYTYFLSHKNKRKHTHFTFEEDALILTLVDRMGKNFSEIAKYVPERSSMQIKNRYSCYLQNPDLTYRPFSIEEDRQILEYAAENNGCNWGALAKMINLPRSHIRHRFNTLCNWLNKNPDKDLSEVPRRYICKANELNAKFEQIKTISDLLKTTEHIPTIDDVRKFMRRKKLKPRKPNTFIRNTIHQQLINFFMTGYKVSRPFTFVTETSTEKDAMIVNDILHILGADLEFPALDEIENDSHLDRMDVFLLSHIANTYQSSETIRPYNLPSIHSSITWSLPPNIGTVVGLRNMIMTLSITKSKPSIRNDINYSDLLELNLESLSDDVRINILTERKRFQQRLYSVFRWPSIMSLTEVGDIKFPCSDAVGCTSEAEKKKRGRPKKNTVQMNLKIKKMLEGRERKRKEKATAAEALRENNYISVKEFAKLERVGNTKDSQQSDQINVGASTSRDCKTSDVINTFEGNDSCNTLQGSNSSNVENSTIQSNNNFVVRKSSNVRTYKRKRNDVHTGTSSNTEPFLKMFVLEDVKPVIKQEESQF